MTHKVQAIYENGAFRPLERVPCHERERVFLTLESAEHAEADLIDYEFLAYCATQADDGVSLETVRRALAKIPGSMVDDIRAERDDG